MVGIFAFRPRDAGERAAQRKKKPLNLLCNFIQTVLPNFRIVEMKQ